MFCTRQHQELIPRSLTAFLPQQDPSVIEQMSKNITRQGLTNATLNYLRLCVILEPMQELMSRHKSFSMSPIDCLKTTLFQKWQRMVTPADNQKQPSKRRKRKASTPNNISTGGNIGKKKNNTSMSPCSTPNFSLTSQDVMVVGEPTLMGGEFGDEDERLITRLENAQYDPTAGAANGLEEGDEFNSIGGPPGPGSSNNQGSAPIAPSTSWSGPSGSSSNPGSVSSNNDNRGVNSNRNGAQGSPEDKKPSPMN